ncbi:MAG: AMP phosphorylase, partial [Thaumarchaeota archaeon]|nr:AMP phosphorylase [Nitrososphaerota archaeon]
MHLRTDILGIESGGKPIVFLNKFDADEIGIRASGRTTINYKKRSITAIVNTTTSVKRGFIGVNEEVRLSLGLKQNFEVDVEIAIFPRSLQFIHNKLTGRRLGYDEISEIVKDVVQGNLNENEISAFVTALSMQGLDLDEATGLALSMVDTGKQLNLRKKTVVDKHSIGGVPGDKTTLLVVPIVAAMGLTIPKVSSRAITSAGGTADRAEALMPVDLKISEMECVVQKSNGCIVWGGSLELAPADDIFVRSEYSLYIDPLLLPSIMSKKKAVNATHLVIDIPTGRGSKMQTISDSDFLAKELIELGRRLGIHTHCVLTNGEKPIGFALGPSLEAREALSVLMNKSHVPDLVDKVCHIAGSIFEMVGKKNGYQLAREVLRSGKAEKKMREIIGLQGGNPKIRIDDLEIGQEKIEVKAKKSGQVLSMDNVALIEIARAAGAPKDKGAGIAFSKKLGDKVRIGDTVYTIY